MAPSPQCRHACLGGAAERLTGVAQQTRTCQGAENGKRQTSASSRRRRTQKSHSRGVIGRTQNAASGGGDACTPVFARRWLRRPRCGGGRCDRRGTTGRGGGPHGQRSVAGPGRGRPGGRCAECSARRRDGHARGAFSCLRNRKRKMNKQTNQSWSVSGPAPRNVESSPKSPSQPARPARSRPGDTLCCLQGWPAGIAQVPIHMPPPVTTLLRGVPEPTAASACFCHTCPRLKPSRCIRVLGWEPPEVGAGPRSSPRPARRTETARRVFVG